MNEYEQYQEDCKRIREVNERLLNDFAAWLKLSGLSEKTINNHVSNIAFYINEYLLYEDATEAKDGVNAVGWFLDYWFIRKAMWASPSSIKGNAASLKKFYAFLQEKGLIGKEDLNDLEKEIREDMPKWLATIARYDEPSVEDVW